MSMNKIINGSSKNLNMNLTRAYPFPLKKKKIDMNIQRLAEGLRSICSIISTLTGRMGIPWTRSFPASSSAFLSSLISLPILDYIYSEEMVT